MSEKKEIETIIVDVKEVDGDSPRTRVFYITVEGIEGYNNTLEAPADNKESVLSEFGVQVLDELKGKRVKVLYDGKNCVRIRRNY